LLQENLHKIKIIISLKKLLLNVSVSLSITKVISTT